MSPDPEPDLSWRSYWGEDSKPTVPTIGLRATLVLAEDFYRGPLLNLVGRLPDRRTVEAFVADGVLAWNAKYRSRRERADASRREAIRRLVPTAGRHEPQVRIIVDLEGRIAEPTLARTVATRFGIRAKALNWAMREALLEALHHARTQTRETAAPHQAAEQPREPKADPLQTPEAIEQPASAPAAAANEALALVGQPDGLQDQVGHEG